MKLDDIAAVLGCSRATASMLRAGKYDRPNSDLHARYDALMRVIEEARRQAALDANAICMTCPRDDCTGCRIAEMQ